MSTKHALKFIAYNKDFIHDFQDHKTDSLSNATVISMKLSMKLVMAILLSHSRSLFGWWSYHCIRCHILCHCHKLAYPAKLVLIFERFDILARYHENHHVILCWRSEFSRRGSTYAILKIFATLWFSFERIPKFVSKVISETKSCPIPAMKLRR